VEKIEAAFKAGAKRFDGAINGFGGCPMAEDKLVGNMDTDLMIPYFKELGLLKNINEEALLKAGGMASKIFV
jgi:hydroxymethylglutaryl-CoA lyase